MLRDSDPDDLPDEEDEDEWEVIPNAKARRRTLKLEEDRSSAIKEVDYRNTLAFFAEGAPEGGSALDVGCGDGFFARRFARSGRFERVYGLDLKYDKLDNCRNLAQMEGIRPEELQLVYGDGTAMPFMDGQLDFVSWSMVMHLLPDLSPALKEIARVLKPDGGRLYATGYVECKCIRDAEDLKQMVAAAGFGDITVSRVNGGVRYVLTAVRGA